jgi:lipoate-protein ligase A
VKRPPWRLILDPPGAAARNMAVDEALLEHVERPVLRLYTWQGPAVSLGYRQKDPAWLARCVAHGVEVVRRVTGGGAVVHAGDLTYSVVAPHGWPGLPEGLQASYSWIRERLVQGLRDAGVPVEPAAAQAGAPRLEICFKGATGFEVEVDGNKLIGSAQRRTPWGFLQHGSIRLADDSALYAAVLDATPPPFAATGVSAREVGSAVAASFARSVGGALDESQLSPAEHQRAQERTRIRASDPLAVPAVCLKSLPAPRR